MVLPAHCGYSAHRRDFTRCGARSSVRERLGPGGEPSPRHRGRSLPHRGRGHGLDLHGRLAGRTRRQDHCRALPRRYGRGHQAFADVREQVLGLAGCRLPVGVWVVAPGRARYRLRAAAGLFGVCRGLRARPAGHAHRRPVLRGVHGPRRGGPPARGSHWLETVDPPGTAQHVRIPARPEEGPRTRRNLRVSLRGNRCARLGVRGRRWGPDAAADVPVVVESHWRRRGCQHRGGQHRHRHVRRRYLRLAAGYHPRGSRGPG